MSELGVYNSSIVQPKGAKPLKSAPKSAVSVSSIATDLSDMDIGVRKPQVKGKGKVKAVPSGDTIIIKGASGKEKRLVVSGVNAPRVGTRKEADEPFGYQAREFLRNKLQDKVVEFVLQSDSAVSGREFAEVSIGGNDVAKMIISAGFAKVALPKSREDKEDKKDPKSKAKPFDISSLHPEKQVLYKLQKEAEAKKLGMFSGKEPNTRTINYDPDMLALYNKYKGKTLKAFVASVYDGTTYRMEIAEAPLEHVVFSFSLAGALSPRTPMKDDKSPQPFGVEAQQFAEARLLGRDVQITLQGIDKALNIYGTVSMPQGNIAVRLVETGLAKYVPWTAAVCTPEDRAALEAANAASVALKHGVYSKDTSAKPAKETKPAFEGSVTQVLSGDSFVVRDQFENDHRVALASVQAPRYRMMSKSDPFAFEAREFLRKSLIGKRVRVIPEYELDTRVFATVYKNKYNVAIELVNAGLGDVVAHSKDADRAANYLELCNAEAVVKAAEKGKFSKKTVPVTITDLTQSGNRKNKDKDAKDEKEKDEEKEKEKVKSKDSKDKTAGKANTERALIALNKIKDNQVHAVLEQVFSPSRVKVYVPALHSYIAVAISGISAPPQVKGEPRSAVSEQGMAFLKKYLQQDVVIEVSMLGRGDSFHANVFHKESGTNFAVSMAKEGLVSLIGFSAERNKFKTQLFAAEKEAKKARKGMWVDYDEEKEAAEAEKARQEAAESIGMGIYSKDGNQYLKVRVTDVVDPIHFYINNTDDKNVALIKEKMAAFDAADAPADFAPTKGSIVCALFSEDNQWYRARIENVSVRANRYSIQYIDFGNVDDVELSALRPIPEELAKIKQLARPCALSALKAPVKGSAYYTQGTEALFQYTNDLEFEARIDFSESGPNGVLHLTLFHESDPSVSINGHMIKAGWAKVNPRPIRKLDSLAAEFEEFQLIARDNHAGIWEYGDCGSDEE